MSQELIQLLVNSVAVGSIVALAAVELTLTYGILWLANFAHGDSMTLGAYLTLIANAIGLKALSLGAALKIGVALLSEKLAVVANARSSRLFNDPTYHIDRSSPLHP